MDTQLRYLSTAGTYKNNMYLYYDVYLIMAGLWLYTMFGVYMYLRSLVDDFDDVERADERDFQIIVEEDWIPEGQDGGWEILQPTGEELDE
ncbi:unnamed protein product [Caenorhabditis brenneri]